jgi:hypothetical protein
MGSIRAGVRGLVAVAKKFLADVKFESDTHRQAVEDMCQVSG